MESIENEKGLLAEMEGCTDQTKMDNLAEQFIGNDPGRQVATVETEGKELFFGAEDKQKVFSNLDMESALGKAIVISCFSGADIPNEKLEKETFHLTNFLMHTAKMADENGEKVEVKRCVLINQEGQTTSFCSEGIISGVGNLVTVYGIGPWCPPIPIKVVERKTRKGFKVKNLVVDIAALKAMGNDLSI